jgi:hypothetical protein
MTIKGVYNHAMAGAPYIEIRVPLGTRLEEIDIQIMRQAWTLAGTQYKAALALGIRPETMGRRMRRGKKLGPVLKSRAGLGRPEHAPPAASQGNAAISSMGGQKESSRQPAISGQQADS